MNAKRTGKPDGLINVLLDSSAEFGDRDDAAMDLGAFDESHAFDALYSIASDPGADADLQERCGESLAQICRRQSRSGNDFVDRLSPSARRLFVATLNQTSATGHA